MISPIPQYTVQVADELKLRLQEWPQERQEKFLILAEQLGKTYATRTFRHAGGKATWVAVGRFHMTYVSDYYTKTITVTDGVPCTHEMNECHGYPGSPHYLGGPA